MKSFRTVTPPATFNSDNFHSICDHLAGLDQDLKAILDAHGYPPMWTRPNSLETLVHIVLEQQVSLASALAALGKLKERLTLITPETILSLSDQEMRACYISRQKMAYLRGLAHAIKAEVIKLTEFENMTDSQIREQLILLKGFGNWTVDIYLIFTLRRADIFPIGDLAAVNGLKRLKNLEGSVDRSQLLEVCNIWRPFRSVACMILWHYYLEGRKKVNPLAR